MPDGLRRPTVFASWPTSIRMARRCRAICAPRPRSGNCRSTPAEAYLRMVSALPNEMRAAVPVPRFPQIASAAMIAAISCCKHFNVDAPLDVLQRAQYADIMTYLPGDILTKVDRASMANSLELRAPFLDQELSHWAFALPDELKLQRGSGGKADPEAGDGRLSCPTIFSTGPRKASPCRWPNGFAGRSARNSRAWRRMRGLRDSGYFDTEAIAAMADASHRRTARFFQAVMAAYGCSAASWSTRRKRS